MSYNKLRNLTSELDQRISTLDHYWVASTPDPDMNQTTPPNTKSEYIDHVIVKVVAGN